MERTYKVIGHRASRREGIYENSGRAFEAAARFADGLETDAVLSADGEIFFVHDMTASGQEAFSELAVHLDPASASLAAGRSMDRLKASEIRRLRLVDGQPVPDLNDLFSSTKDSGPDFMFDIEIRAVGIFEPLQERISAFVKSGQVRWEQISILSFDHPELALGRHLFPEIRLCAHFDAGNFMRTPIWPGRGVDERCFIPFSFKALDDPLLKAVDPDFIGLNEYDFHPDIVERITQEFPRAKLRIWWLYSEPLPQDNERFWNTLRVLERAGRQDLVSGIITDYPKAMRAFLDGRAD